MINRLNTRVRGSLVAIIVSYTLDLGAFNSASDGNLTLVTGDSERIAGAFEMFNDLWANPISVGIGLWLLARKLGLGSIGPLVPVMSELNPPLF
jgi:ATP-binding cassette subfamily C (CFTR/MRP) protein 1